MRLELSSRVALHNGVQMPWFGLGVYKVQAGGEVEHAVRAAIATGYRSIDTAALYGNEEGVGRAIQASGAARDEIFVTTKVWNTDQGFDTTREAFETSRRKLGLDVVDLYLIHWPVKGKYLDTWRAMEELYREGKVRAIGVSNFQIHHLQDLLDHCEIRPMVNQVEYHPYLTQVELRTFCEQNQIRLEAWAPLMRGRLMDDPVLQQIASAHEKTVAQVVLRWDLQHGVVTIPKSVRPERIRENADIFDFELSEQEMAQIDGLNRNERCGPDPDNFHF
ncbi:aldo/keto reductase [Alicyclobacillus cycloheptanicus]|uniref:Diketogulonate reductase-like aldo/keto reductase n=1 Tax=Alicyclobacillus cycloheptanicus TaxID=1457 RepID=A0ABT9XKJ3_9BACL|nr:aldo/keto reductase [Alicyclobacillus cycloheptanicus]MDQ0190798.1 diketogulonate reductase-like aldo/keto reductase [Alicyclobacillus cycloheptanicus]WDM02720.1 aldo/keto reductase [Alicyclobacillus cycloheptanicus]